MFRLILFIQIGLLYSCTTSRSVNHFATKSKLTIKKAANINFFNGKIEIEENSKEGVKDPVYLLYKDDSLLFVSRDKWIENNEFIYRISHRIDSTIILTRGTMFPRYYTADTLLFGSDFAIEKSCLYDNKKVIQSFYEEYRFFNDSLHIYRYQFDRDVLPILFYKSDLKARSEQMGRPHEVRSEPNQEKHTFFRRYIN
jgi:hypothetical protein